jgi:hypothetical protein
MKNETALSIFAVHPDKVTFTQFNDAERQILQANADRLGVDLVEEFISRYTAAGYTSVVVSLF